MPIPWSWPPLREREQRAAAEIIGYAGVTFLHLPDGALVNDLVLREHLVREIRTFRPDAVLATDPTVIFYRDGGINHTDHREAGIAAIDAVYPASRNPMAFPALARSGLEAHRVRRLYLFWPNEPNVRVDITATLDRKIDALAPTPARSRSRSSSPSGSGPGPRRRVSRSAWRPREALRLVVIDDDEAEGPDAGLAAGPRRRRPPDARLRIGGAVSRPSSSTGRTVPHSFQSSVRLSARRPSSVTSSPSVSPPAAAATYSSAATRTPANSSRVSASVGQRRIRIGSCRRSPRPSPGRAGSAPARRPSRRSRRTGSRATRGRPRCRGSGVWLNGPQKK